MLSTEPQKLSLEVPMDVYVYGIPAKRPLLLVLSQARRSQSSLTAGLLHLETALTLRKDV